MRHHQSLTETDQALSGVLQGIDQNITNDLLAQNLRLALFHLGEITGEITVILDNGLNGLNRVTLQRSRVWASF